MTIGLVTNEFTVEWTSKNSKKLVLPQGEGIF